MLIPIGFFGGGASAAPSYELIATSAGGASSITFSSIPQTYKHLQLRVVARTNQVDSNDDFLQIRYNGVTSASYVWHTVYNISANYGVTATSIRMGAIGSNRNNNTWPHGMAIIDIPEYSSTVKNKTAKSVSGVQNPFVNLVGLWSGFYPSTSAISSITFIASTGATFASTSRFSLYGIVG